MARRRGTADDKLNRSFAVEAAQLLADRRCEDVRLVDVRGVSQVCDYMVIGSGTSERQMKSVASELEDLAGDRDMGVFRRAEDTGRTWVVIDFVDVVAHLFEPNQRMYYDLDGLWADGRLIDWRRADQRTKHAFSGEIGLNGEVRDE